MFSKSLTQEIKKIIKKNNLKYSIRDFKNGNEQLTQNFCYISINNALSEEFIEHFYDKLGCRNIAVYQKLSESFIEKLQDKMHWTYISVNQKLSESFIEKFQDKVDWFHISAYQNLSESFIERHQDKISWPSISYYQKLSEEFIEKFQNKVDWFYVSQYQNLSEEFIEKFQDKVDWKMISKYHKLSEEFIEKFKNNVDWNNIAKYQKLSSQFRKKYEIKINKSNWLYKPATLKLKYIKEYTNYEVIDDKYIIAYKGVRSDNYSKTNFQHKYEIGKTYESHCDCNANNDSSFGLSAWTFCNEKKYIHDKILKVKIAIEDLGCIVDECYKIRCFRFEVLEEVKIR